MILINSIVAVQAFASFFIFFKTLKEIYLKRTRNKVHDDAGQHMKIIINSDHAQNPVLNKNKTPDVSFLYAYEGFSQVPHVSRNSDDD